MCIFKIQMTEKNTNIHREKIVGKCNNFGDILTVICKTNMKLIVFN